MPHSIGDRLRLAQQQAIVGRETEIALFSSALKSSELPFCVLSVSGQGGVGKTTLLRSFLAICAENSIHATYLDTRNIAASPESFLPALQSALGLTPDQDPMAFLGAQEQRQVLLLDTYETLAALDGWMRDFFLPRLSAQTLVVLAGRQPLPAAWRASPGWDTLLQSVSLENLSQSESRSYLSRRAIPDAQHEAVLDFTRGHPLALSLVADLFVQRGQIPDHLALVPESAPDVVQALLERFVHKVPSSRHRTALEICALVRLTNEALLADILHRLDETEGVENSAEKDDAAALFDWLRGLSFIECEERGLFPHDVVREVLLADVRWRNRDRYTLLHHCARDYYAAHLPRAHGHEQQRLLYDCIFLHRDNSVVRAAFTFQENQAVYADTLRSPQDQDDILQMVARHEGDDSARIAGHWLKRQPEATLIFRDHSARWTSDASAEPETVGFLMILSLQEAHPDDIGADPATAAAWRYLESTAPLRKGETATYFRFWMTRDTYQEPGPVHSLLIVHALRYFLTRSQYAYTFFACRDPEAWAPIFDYVEIPLLNAAKFTVGQQHYGVFGHDWRTQAAGTWLARLAEKETAAAQPTPDAATAAASSPSSNAVVPTTRPALRVLTREEFADAMRALLRDYAGPDHLLFENPLRHSRLVSQQQASRSAPGGMSDLSPATHADLLRRVIREAAESLQSAPRLARGYRALFHTYLQPAPTQERAAEILDLPFSTFRRHLGEGIMEITRLLWLQETGGGE